MRVPSWRPLGVVAACATAFAFPAAGATPPTIAALHVEQTSIAQQRRSAVLDLYSLDAQLATAQSRLDGLLAQAARLRAEQKVLATELHIARVDTRVSQQRLASRLKALYDHGGTNTLEVLFGATSISDAFDQLDNINRVSSVDGEIVSELRATRVRELRTRQQLGAREAALTSAISEASGEEQSLASVRSQRQTLIASLQQREAVTTFQVAQLETQAQAAAAKSQQLTETPPATPRAVTGGELTMVSTGYCLGGYTATGIPVGWGVVAVDPSVIPLGTHLTIPGYGEAVAADTGSAIVGNRLDLWFPTCAQADAWGMQSVTISLG